MPKLTYAHILNILYILFDIQRFTSLQGETLQSFKQWVVDIRQHFHRCPELSFKEFGTQSHIISLLEELGIVCRKIADTGVIAEIHGKGSGPCIAIRSDIDALAVQESLTKFNKNYISGNPGVMHACGHDGHIAMVLGVARLIMENRTNIYGTVRFIFQPAEEAPPGGATKIIAEGGLDGVDAIIGIHIFGDVEAGVIKLFPGSFMASSNLFTLKLFGKGGHHSTPGQCVDPIRISSDFISCLNEFISNSIQPDDYVLGFGTIHSGQQFNRTPDELCITGTFRTFDDKGSQLINVIMHNLLDCLMSSYSIDKIASPTYELKVTYGYPVLFNDPSFTEAAIKALKRRSFLFDTNSKSIFGAEDFSYYLKEIPGTYMIIGTRNTNKGFVEVNHSSCFDIDEDILFTGIDALYCIATDFLKNPLGYT